MKVRGVLIFIPGILGRPFCRCQDSHSLSSWTLSFLGRRFKWQTKKCTDFFRPIHSGSEDYGEETKHGVESQVGLRERSLRHWSLCRVESSFCFSICCRFVVPMCLLFFFKRNLYVFSAWWLAFLGIGGLFSRSCLFFVG